MPNTDPEGAGDPWVDTAQTLADRLLKETDRFVRSLAPQPQPHLRPVLIREALALADEMVTLRLAEGRVSRPD
jgi:hypothetical protein